MTSSTCPQCGHTFDDHQPTSVPPAPSPGYDAHLPPVPDIGTTGTVAEQAPASRRALPQPRSILIAAVVAVAAIIAAVVAFGGDERTAVDDPVINDGGTGGTSTVDADATQPSRSGDPNFPPSDEHMAADSISDLFTSLVDDDRRWSAIYASPLGLQILNSFGTSEPAIEVAVGFEEAARFPLISDGSTSWAINPNAIDTAFLVSTQFVVIDIDREGRVGFVNDSLDPPNIGESSFGAWGPGFDLPAGAEVLPVSGRALFVLPSTGGTFEYVTNGVQPFSDDVLVAASANAEVFERCDDQLVCELYAVTPAFPDGRVLDYDVRSQVWISPDGVMVIAQEPNAEPELLWLDTDTRRALNGPVLAVDWADDVSRAAILSDTQLTMLLPDNSMASVTLPIEPVGAAVLLVNSSE